MRQQISKRVEALERAADREFFAARSLTRLPTTSAARNTSRRFRTLTPERWATKISKNLQASADLLLQPSDHEDRAWGFRARAQRAQGKLLAKFGSMIFISQARQPWLTPLTGLLAVFRRNGVP